MNIEQARFNMIECQIRPAGVGSQEVLDLLSVVRREHFVPEAYAGLAFADIEIPLPCGENMFTPILEALILQAAAVKSHESVLEIGAGSGYMAALLAHRARHVVSVEIHPFLRDMAQASLQAYGLMNVEVALGNGAQGWGSADEHDVIVISGSLPFMPEAFLRQVKVGGRVLAIIGEAPAMSLQRVTRVSVKTYQTVSLFETCVKPLLETGYVRSLRF